MADDFVNQECTIPHGLDYLFYTLQHQSRCENFSLSRVKELGDNVPQTIEKIGTVLSLLDQLASCSWGCHGGNHAIEYLVGRTASYGVAALRLVNFGHYDEALALTRSIAEIANLMNLFWVDRSAIRRWSEASNRQ